MNAIPGLTGHAEDMLRVLGDHYIGQWFGHIISFVFGFLLLSAANTAIMDFVSIQFLMAKDKELPESFSNLNPFGMPWIALAVAVAVPCLVLIFEHDVLRLAALYAIGVIGAITLNLGSSATNFNIHLKRRERALLMSGSIILFFIELTIAYQKRQALVFATSIVGIGLILRYAAKKFVPISIEPAVPSIEVLTVSEAKEIASLYRSSSLVAIRNLNTHLLDEAALRLKALGERSVYISYVEEAPLSPELTEVEPSKESLQLLGQAMLEMQKKGINAIPIWQLGDNPGKLISSAAKELGVDTVMIGTTRRSGLIRLLRGDVLRMLARNLPQECHLSIIG